MTSSIVLVSLWTRRFSSHWTTADRWSPGLAPLCPLRRVGSGLPGDLARPPGGTAGAAAFHPWHVPEREDSQAQARYAGPDPPPVASGKTITQHRNDNQGDCPRNGDDRRHQLVVSFQGWRRGPAGAAHMIQANRSLPWSTCHTPRWAPTRSRR